MTALAEAAQHLAVDLGWRVLPVKEHGKLPLTPHGVKDASADERTILHWWDRWPEANVGVATGAPGPAVLDIDDPAAAAFMLASLEGAGTPESATARGRHLFYAGTDMGTISLGYGELRGRGSYVVVPPSIHPSGKLYIWLVEPQGRALPPVPASVIGDKQTAGVGELPAREGKVGHGERHDHLKDVAVRLLRAGITDVPTLSHMLRAEYEAACEQEPPARADEFQKLAEWAAHTRMASRERNRAERDAGEAEDAKRWAPPAVDAAPSAHRAYIARAAGLAANVQIKEVRRYGSRVVDGMQIDLSNGDVIEFARQAEVTQFGGWRRAVTIATGGRAMPPAMKEPQLLNLLRSLCLIAHTSRAQTEAEQHADTLREFLVLTEPVLGYELTTAATRYRLIDALRQRERWDPFDRNTLVSPAQITDERDGARYLRGGELWDYYRHRGAGLSTREFPGRMTMVGLEHIVVNGREPMPLDPSRGRRTARAVLYRLGEA